MRDTRKEEAVSEVVGTILVLAITIVLFLAVFAYVQHFPLATQSEQVTIYQELYYDPVSMVVTEKLSDKTGSILPTGETFLIVLINGTAYSKPISSLQIYSPYGNNTGLLKPGDIITWNSSFTGVSVANDSTISSILFYKPSNQVLWQSRNVISDQLSISAFYVTPSPIRANETFTVIVQVSTFDTTDTSAHLNLTSLYGTGMNVTMDAYSTSGSVESFYYTGKAPPTIHSNSFITAFVEADGVSTISQIDVF